MKYMHILIALTISNSLCASEQKQLDPFSAAHEQYNLSNWDKACTLYLTTFAKIDDGTIKKENIDPMALVKGYVNCGDVLYAQGAGAYNRGEKEIAKQLMLSACDLWSHRLGGRQFGRAPLNNEWDGSDLTGKTLVVYSERDGGAFGDTFYMTGLLRYVKEKGARVIFVPQKPLAKLYDKNHLPNALQTHYVDQVVLRSEELPQHDVAIYLWSILKYYLHDTAMEKAFPMKPCLSGMTLLDYGLITAISQRGIQLKKPPFLIGMWWRSSGPASMAADWRTLDRDPGAHRMLSVIQKLPVLVINLEGLGRFPLSEELLEAKQKAGSANNSDMVDVTTYQTDNVFSFGPEFDKNIPFSNTLAVMKMIKNKGGILIGCDTGLCNAAAMVEKNEEKYPEPSVFAILNERADHRWGNDKTSPRSWHHSNDVLVFQAQEQGKWEAPLKQARKILKQRINTK